MQLQMQETERRTGLSRNTISKYLRADTGESKFKGPTWLSKFDRFEPKLLD